MTTPVFALKAKVILRSANPTLDSTMPRLERSMWFRHLSRFLWIAKIAHSGSDTLG